MSNATKNYMKNGGSEWVVGGKITIAPGGSVEGLPQAGGTTYDGVLLKSISFESPTSLSLSGAIAINVIITTVNPATNTESVSNTTISISSQMIKDANARTENSF